MPKYNDDLSITFTREEYDQIKADIAELFELHQTLRRLSAFVFSGNPDGEDRGDLKMHVDHFVGVYPPREAGVTL